METPLTTRIGCTIFIALFPLFAIVITFLIIGDIWHIFDQRSWEARPCIILESSVRENPKKPYFTFEVKYQYEYNDETYISKSFRDDHRGSDYYSNVDKLVQKYPVGSETICFVNPNDPQMALLERTSLFNLFFLLIPLSMIFIGFKLIMWISHDNSAPSQSVAKTYNKKNKGVFKYIFYTALIILGAIFFYILTIKPIISSYKISSWDRIPCSIIYADIREERDRDSVSHSIYMLYEYELDARKYRSEKIISTFDRMLTLRAMNRKIEMYQSAEILKCYVNPKDPNDAFLSRRITIHPMVGLFALLAFLIGITGIYYLVTGYCPQGLDPEKPWNQPWQSSSKTQKENEISSIDNLSKKLSPDHSMRGCFWTAFLSAVFWNGYLWFLILYDIRVIRGEGFNMPQFDIITWVFLIIGLLMLIPFIYTLFSLFNPSAELIITPFELTLGTSVRLKWKFSKSCYRIKKLSIKLCVVEKIYSKSDMPDNNQGKDMKNGPGSKILYEVKIFESSRSHEMQSGQVDFVIPREEAPHSLYIKDYSISWQIIVHGEIPFFPDLEDSYTLTVMPEP